jgi:hypothetical protein
MMTSPTGPGGLLGLVRQGMEVYDAEGNKIGTVKRVYMGGGNDPADVRRQRQDAGADPAAGPHEADSTFLGDLFESFTPTGGMPDELRQKLEREGFVEIDAGGLFSDDRYATPDRIAEVTDDRVILGASGGGLIKE